MSWNKSVVYETWTHNKTGDDYTSITVVFNGYLRADLKMKTLKIDRDDGISSVQTVEDPENSNSLYTETYTYDIPEAKQWTRPWTTGEKGSDAGAEGQKWKDTKKTIEEDSDYINKRDSIITQTETHNG